MNLVISIALLFLGAPCHALHIILDPGHGGKDHGATRGSFREADLSLTMALEIKSQLESQTHDTVTLTRTTDMFKTLSERTQLAETVGGDLFLSIHANSSPEGKAQGPEFYFQNQIAPSEDVFYLANFENGADQTFEVKPDADDPLTKKNDIKRILEDLGRFQRLVKSQTFTKDLHWGWGSPRKHKAIRQAPFYVISKVKMPSALVELGYISNPKEASLLASPSYQKKMAGQIVAAIRKYKSSLSANATEK